MADAVTAFKTRPVSKFSGAKKKGVRIRILLYLVMLALEGRYAKLYQAEANNAIRASHRIKYADGQEYAFQCISLF